MSASNKELGDLHSLLALTLAAQMKADPSNSSMLNCVRQFLKDNNIVSAVEHDDNLKRLIAALPHRTSTDTGLTN